MSKFYFLLFLTCSLGLSVLMSGCNGDDPVTPTPPETEDPKVAIVGIEVGEITYDSVSANFTPDSKTVKYMYAIGDDNDRSDFENGLLAGTLIQEDNSAIEYTFEGLEEGKRYTIFAAGYNSEGEIHAVQTSSVLIAVTGLDLKVQFAAVDCAAVSLRMSYDFLSYEYAFYEGSDASGTKLESGSYSEVFKYTYTYFDLKHNAEYFFTAKATTRWGEEFEKSVVFKTKNASEVPAVNLNTLDFDIYAGTFNVAPANELTGAIATMYCTPGQYDLQWQEPTTWYGNLAGMITAMGKASFMDCYYSENNGHTFSAMYYDLIFNYDLQIIAVSYYKDSDEVGNIQYFDFATPAYDPSAEKPGPMTIDIVKVEPYNVEYSFTTGANTMGFAVQTFYKDDFEQIYLPEEVLNPGYIGNFIYDNYGIFYTIYSKLPFDNWTDWVWPNDSFYAVAVPFNVNGPGYGWGDVVYKMFTTPTE